MKRSTGLWALLLTGCGRYADFTLPVQPRGSVPQDFRLEARPEPVLRRGGPGEWDSRDALNPSVAGGLMLYSGFDGRTWRTGLATSGDGLEWTKGGVVLAPDPKTWEGDYIAANGSLLRRAGGWLYWYQAGPRETPQIGLARSTDGRSWTKHPAPVVPLGPRGSWDERAMGDPYVVEMPPYLYMFYLGQDRAVRQRLGVARSRDGVVWEKLRANPVMELGEAGAFDENGLGEPAVWAGQGGYWMLYTGRDARENRRLGMARSRDGVAWQKQRAVFAGPEAWNSKVLCDPTVEVQGDSVRVWFGGGDRPSPDENLNGQIGYGVLRPVSATLAK
jgi:predicted GH43/DUF377 family glycosyl hydrolase